MENKFINRYNTFCKSLQNLEKSKTADPKAAFVLEGTVLNFSLTFDISWKVMKDILIKNLASWILPLAHHGKPFSRHLPTNSFKMTAGCKCFVCATGWLMITTAVTPLPAFQKS